MRALRIIVRSTHVYIILLYYTYIIHIIIMCVYIGRGMNIYLKGFANDYVCKGMAGGKVVISPFSGGEGSIAAADRNKVVSSYSVAGNTVLYGATGGTLHIHGRAGERFAVRNSGALGVVEGLGDHGCEYMVSLYNSICYIIYIITIYYLIILECNICIDGRNYRMLRSHRQ